jgi:hypothetical protein
LYPGPQLPGYRLSSAPRDFISILAFRGDWRRERNCIPTFSRRISRSYAQYLSFIGGGTGRAWVDHEAMNRAINTRAPTPNRSQHNQYA